MIQFPRSLALWKTPEFESALRDEIIGLEKGVLPLQQGLSQGSYSNDRDLGVMVISSKEDTDFIRIKTGIFYASIIAGCSCTDDPAPLNENAEYCVVQFDINKSTAEVSIAYLRE